MHTLRAGPFSVRTKLFAHHLCYQEMATSIGILTDSCRVRCTWGYPRSPRRHPPACFGSCWSRGPADGGCAAVGEHGWGCGPDGCCPVPASPDWLKRNRGSGVYWLLKRSFLSQRHHRLANAVQLGYGILYYSACHNVDLSNKLQSKEENEQYEESVERDWWKFQIFKEKMLGQKCMLNNLTNSLYY